MVYRQCIFANDEIYHVFNRGTESRSLFTCKREYLRGLQTLSFYRFTNLPFQLGRALILERDERENFFKKLKKEGIKLVEIICFSLMPNHFHFLLRQKIDKGISTFISNFSNSYTRYFNTRNKRSGSLLQGPFKAKRIENDEQLMHISRYIHLNPVVSYVIEDNELDSYPWSSFPEYLGDKNIEAICNKEIVLSLFRSKKDYREFVHNQIDYAKRLEKIKHLEIEGRV